jgi:hypothetical protein
MDMKEQRTAPATTLRTPPSDDGPEDMELTISKGPAEALDAANSVFDADMKKHFQGINTQGSVFERGTVFRTNRESPGE